MVPQTILRELSRLRRREHLLRFLWGAARWLALVAGVLAFCCLLDWTIDRYTDTPWPLRYVLFFIQLALGLGAVGYFLLKPLIDRLPDSRLALMVEDRHPQLNHRLISTVQLNQPDADTEGMSRELIAAVTRETEEMAPRINFPATPDHRRLRWSAWAILPTAAVAVLAFVLMPETLPVLLARQMLMDRDIPRSIYLSPQTAEVWPSGEDVTLRFRVWGPALASDLREAKGKAYAYPKDSAREEYDLVLESQSSGEAVFTAKVRPMAVDFTFTAALLDGRTHQDGNIHYVARPAITRLDAWMILPPHSGFRELEDGTRLLYEVPQSRGDIVGLRKTMARVAIKVQKPVVQAVLETLGPPYPNMTRQTDESATQRNMVEAASGVSAVGLLSGPLGPLDAVIATLPAKSEVVLRRMEQKFKQGTQAVEWKFDLLPTETSYRVTVLDSYGFANLPFAPRALTVIQERAPVVALLAERFLPRAEFRLGGRDEDFEVDGLPIAIEDTGKPGAVRIAYTVTGPYGLGKAQLRYRVVKKSEGSQEGPEGGPEPTWMMIPLSEIPEGDKGLFDPKRGLFRESEDSEIIPFHARPTLDPPYLLPRSVGGGSFVFEASGIPDGKGGLVELKAGDQVEYFVEVFNRNPDRDWAVVGRSETRTKTIVNAAEFGRWVFETLQEENRLRQLENRQRGVFLSKQK